MSLKPSDVKLLANFYQNSPDHVWILGENWEKLWTNQKKYFTEPDFQKLLNLPIDCWENKSDILYWDFRFLQYSLVCNPVEKCRIIMMKKEPPACFQEQEREISDSVFAQSLINMKSRCPDNAFRNMLMQKYYFLNRRLTMSRLLKDFWNLDSNLELFEVHEQLVEIQKKTIPILKDCAEIQFLESENAKSCYLEENRNIFVFVVLACILLCYQKQEYFHHIHLKLEIIGQKGILQVSVKADYQRLVDRSEQLDPDIFGKMELEHYILQMFCLAHEGKWKLLSYPEGEGKLCHVSFQLSQKVPSPIMHSPKEYGFSNRNRNLYLPILSRIYFPKDIT